MKAKVLRKQNIILLVSIFVIAMINQPYLKEGFQRTLRGLFVSYAYIGVVIYWSISALESIRDKSSRRVLKGIVGMLLFWLAVRGVKYEVWDERVNMIAWYLFYVPQIFLPLFTFYMTLYIDGDKQAKHTKLLMIPAGIIAGGILTNNYHQLAFKFADGVINDDHYSYGPFYYLSWVWMGVFMLAAILNAVAKSRLQNKRGVMHLLIAWLFVPILYIVYYSTGPFIARTYILNFPEAFCLIHMIFLEICMGSGLLVSNRYHREIFSDASIMAEITDENCNPVHRTTMCEPISMEDKLATVNTPKEKAVIINNTYEMHTTEIPGGHAFWLTDIRKLLEINENLRSIGEELAEENNILEAEIAITEQRAAIEEQNRIYDRVNEAIKDKKEELLNLLEDRNDLKKALLLAVYMKRKSNLLLLARQEQYTDIRELGLCISESFRYLRLHNCICNCTVIGNGSVPAYVLGDFYALFEEVMEETYEGANAMLAFVKVEAETVMLRLVIDHDKEQCVNEENLSFLCTKYNINHITERQDDGMYITFLREEVEHA